MRRERLHCDRAMSFTFRRPVIHAHQKVAYQGVCSVGGSEENGHNEGGTEYYVWAGDRDISERNSKLTKN